ncbi:hypothetical protein ACRRTK_008343 [Alexandromys fortis]
MLASEAPPPQPEEKRERSLRPLQTEDCGVGSSEQIPTPSSTPKFISMDAFVWSGECGSLLDSPGAEEEKRKHKKKRLVQSPNSYFMDVKCPGCYKITTVFSHAQTEHFDKDGWSLWHAEHHFPQEFTQTFMSCNLITGMFQLLDKWRENAFAGVTLFGTSNGSSVYSIWVSGGQELAFPLSSDWQEDNESYTWQKLDPGIEETQTLV